MARIIASADIPALQQARPLVTVWHQLYWKMRQHPLGKDSIYALAHRRKELRRHIWKNLYCRPRGKGNNAWKRVDALHRRTDVLYWPDYLR